MRQNNKPPRRSLLLMPLRALLIKALLIVVLVVVVVLVARHYINKVSSTSTMTEVVKDEKIDITPLACHAERYVVCNTATSAFARQQLHRRDTHSLVYRDGQVDSSRP